MIFLSFFPLFLLLLFFLFFVYWGGGGVGWLVGWLGKR